MTTNFEQLDETSSAQVQALLDEIASIKADHASPEAHKVLDVFVQGAKTFIPAQFLAQDALNPEHRMADLVGGIPFTSDAFPWPVTPGSGLHMQPIVQINLEFAGQSLKLDLGVGLLQVWASVFPTADELSDNLDDPFVLRIIPLDALQEPLNAFIPDFRPWTYPEDDPNFGTAGCLMQPSDDEDFKNQPMLKWDSARPMFGGFHHLYGVLSSSEAKALGGDDDYAQLAEDWASQLDFSEISIGWHSIYLGGLGGQAGGPEDPTFHENLLIRIADGNGFHFGIGLSHDRQGKPVFEPLFRIRA